MMVYTMTFDSKAERTGVSSSSGRGEFGGESTSSDRPQLLARALPFGQVTMETGNCMVRKTSSQYLISKVAYRSLSLSSNNNNIIVERASTSLSTRTSRPHLLYLYDKIQYKRCDMMDANKSENGSYETFLTDGRGALLGGCLTD
jgi:hypothetical protein